MLVSQSPKKVLTVGGWDACGTFGVPADIKTFSSLGCHGMAVLTIATVLNSKGWFGAHPLSAEFVGQQLDAVLMDYGADAIKTGFLGREEIVQTVAEKIKTYRLKNVVVDPVLLDGQGHPMFGLELNKAYEKYLFPLATVITPNLRELNYLLNKTTDKWILNAQSETRLSAYYQAHLTGEKKALMLLKGIRHNGLFADAYFDGRRIHFESKDEIDTDNLSGSGDTFSAAITAYLAQGNKAQNAVKSASYFTQSAIEQSASWQLASGAGPVANITMRTQDTLENLDDESEI